MRINQTKATAIGSILIGQIGEKGGFPRAGLPKDVHMQEPFTGGKAKGRRWLVATVCKAQDRWLDGHQLLSRRWWCGGKQSGYIAIAGQGCHPAHVCFDAPRGE